MQYSYGRENNLFKIVIVKNPIVNMMVDFNDISTTSTMAKNWVLISVLIDHKLNVEPV